MYICIYICIYIKLLKYFGIFNISRKAMIAIAAIEVSFSPKILS